MGRPKKTRTTIDPQGWGGTASVEVIAPEPEPPAPIVVPEGDDARVLLQKLAEANQRVTAARLRWEESATTTKQRKAKLDQLSAELSRMLTEATEGSKTPLLDAAEGEADLARMEAAIAAAAAAPAEAQGSETETSGETGMVDALNGPVEAPDAIPGALEEPFHAEGLETEPEGNVLAFPSGQVEPSEPSAATPEIF
jgi:hypothetical protein